MQFKKWTIHNIKYEKPLRNHLKFQQFLTFLLVKSNNFLNDYNFHRLSVKMLYVGAEKCAKRNCQKENVKLDCQLTCGECTPANITTLPPTNITTLAPTSNTTTPKVITQLYQYS